MQHRRIHLVMLKVQLADQATLQQEIANTCRTRRAEEANEVERAEGVVEEEEAERQVEVKGPILSRASRGSELFLGYRGSGGNS